MYAVRHTLRTTHDKLTHLQSKTQAAGKQAGLGSAAAAGGGGGGEAAPALRSVEMVEEGRKLSRGNMEAEESADLAAAAALAAAAVDNSKLRGSGYVLLCVIRVDHCVRVCVRVRVCVCACTCTCVRVVKIA